MGLFSKLLGIKKPNLAAQEEAAFKREMKRIKAQRVEERETARFALSEGEGQARQADFELGGESDFDDLDDNQRAERSSGRLEQPVDTGLIL